MVELDANIISIETKYAEDESEYFEVKIQFGAHTGDNGRPDDDEHHIDYQKFNEKKDALHLGIVKIQQD